MNYEEASAIKKLLKFLKLKLIILSVVMIIPQFSDKNHTFGHGKR